MESTRLVNPSVREARARLARKVWWDRLSLVCAVFITAALLACGARVVQARVTMGKQSRTMISELQSDPSKYLTYISYVPSEFHRSFNGSQPHGPWALEERRFTETGLVVGDLIEGHCDLDRLGQVLRKRGDTTWCGPGSANSLGCVGGYWLDRFQKPNELSSDSLPEPVVRSCPDGFFCPAGQVCYILCALGGACNSSMPVPHWAHSADARSIKQHSSAVLESASLDIASTEAVEEDKEGTSPLLPATSEDAAWMQWNGDSPPLLTAGAPDQSWRHLGNASFYTCKFLPGTAKEVLAPPKSSGLPGCPGVAHLFLCPAGLHCPTPIKAQSCPKGSYCPLGSDRPIKCPPFLHLCEVEGLTAPNTRSLASTVTLLCLGLLALLTWIETRPAPNPLQSSGGAPPRRNVSMDLLIPPPPSNKRRKRAPRHASSSSLSAIGATGSSNASSYATIDQQQAIELEPEEAGPLSPRSTWLSEVPFADPPLDVCFNGLGLKLSSGRQVLKGVSGEFKSGRLAAILGPSGVGKTSFLNALCGKGAAQGTVTGSVTVQLPGEGGINGAGNGVVDATTSEEGSFQRPVEKKGSILRDLTYVVGLVPQEDSMHGWLTVEENLWLYARLRRRSSRPISATQRKVTSIMKVLGLYAHRNARIGDPDRRRGISGGQRKRVNVAMELVLDPSILFLDEPTTGLDSASALDLTQALKLLAESRNLTIAAVIHQPSTKVFECFHDVLLLGAGGAAAYVGPTDGALPYFSSIGYRKPSSDCAADFMLDLTCGKVPFTTSSSSSLGGGGNAALSPHELTAAWTQHTNRHADDQEVEIAQRHSSYNSSTSPLADPHRYNTYGSAPSSSSSAAAAGSGPDVLTWREKTMLVEAEQPWWIECFLLFAGRAIVEHLRFPAEFFYEVCLQLLVGFVVGALYAHFNFHDLQQMTFMVALAVGFTVSLASSRVFGPNMVVCWREAAQGVGMGLSPSAYFTAKCVVELPRIGLLSLALLATFYPQACPRASFKKVWLATAAAAFAASGWSYFLTAWQDPKSAQLSLVVVIVLSAMFCGIAPRLPELSSMGAIPVGSTWFSYARWYVESLYVEETTLMSDAWRMPPPFYEQPAKESAILGLQSMAYVEGSTTLDFCLLGLLGLFARALALTALVATNRDKMGDPPVPPVACIKRAALQLTCRGGDSPSTNSRGSSTSAREGGEAAIGSSRVLSAALLSMLGMQQGGSEDDDEVEEGDQSGHGSDSSGQAGLELSQLQG